MQYGEMELTSRPLYQLVAIIPEALDGIWVEGPFNS